MDGWCHWESQPRSSCRTAATAALASAGHKYWLLSLDDHLFCLCAGTHEIQLVCYRLHYRLGDTDALVRAVWKRRMTAAEHALASTCQHAMGFLALVIASGTAEAELLFFLFFLKKKRSLTFTLGYVARSLVYR